MKFHRISWLFNPSFALIKHRSDILFCFVYSNGILVICLDGANRISSLASLVWKIYIPCFDCLNPHYPMSQRLVISLAQRVNLTQIQQFAYVKQITWVVCVFFEGKQVLLTDNPLVKLMPLIIYDISCCNHVSLRPHWTGLYILAFNGTCVLIFQLKKNSDFV